MPKTCLTRDCNNPAYTKEGQRGEWLFCLDCIRAKHIPKTLNENPWFNSSRFWKEQYLELEKHHKKMMRRFSMRTQRRKKDMFKLKRISERCDYAIVRDISALGRSVLKGDKIPSEKRKIIMFWRDAWIKVREKYNKCPTK